MLLLRIRHRLVAWLAMWAMLVGALAPAIAQARVAQAGGNDWLEICSISGMVWVKADTGETRHQSPGQDTPAGAAKCPWCTLHGGMAGLPGASWAPDFSARLTDLPPAFYRAPVTAAVWAPALSRGPPATA